MYYSCEMLKRLSVGGLHKKKKRFSNVLVLHLQKCIIYVCISGYIYEKTVKEA